VVLIRHRDLTFYFLLLCGPENLCFFKGMAYTIMLGHDKLLEFIILTIM
jgi:hypothetical protein